MNELCVCYIIILLYVIIAKCACNGIKGVRDVKFYEICVVSIFGTYSDVLVVVFIVGVSRELLDI